MTHEDEETRIADEYSNTKRYLAEAVWREAFRGGTAVEVQAALLWYDVARAAALKDRFVRAAA